MSEPIHPARATPHAAITHWPAAAAQTAIPAKATVITEKSAASGTVAMLRLEVRGGEQGEREPHKKIAESDPVAAMRPRST